MDAILGSPQLQQSKDILTMIWEAKLVRYHGVGALVFLMWDILLTLGDEVQFIWPQNLRSPTKWVFLFTRYFGLLAQARLVSVNLMLDSYSFSMDVCRMLYVSQVTFGGVLMACTQALLMLRVYALYSQDRRVAFSMISLLVVEIGSMPGVIHLTIPTAAGNMCMKPITIRDIALFGITALFPQLLVLGLTLVKFLSGLRAGWGKIPIVSLLVRDDIILVSVIVVWTIITAALTSISTVYGYIGFYWLLSVIPSVGCRVVINMQRLAGKEPRDRNRVNARDTASTLQFTSFILDALSLPFALENNMMSHPISRTPSCCSDITPNAVLGEPHLRSDVHCRTSPSKAIPPSTSFYSTAKSI